jgi:hypothetical protein
VKKASSLGRLLLAIAHAMKVPMSDMTLSHWSRLMLTFHALPPWARAYQTEITANA